MVNLATPFYFDTVMIEASTVTVLLIYCFIKYSYLFFCSKILVLLININKKNIIIDMFN